MLLHSSLHPLLLQPGRRTSRQLARGSVDRNVNGAELYANSLMWQYHRTIGAWMLTKCCSCSVCLAEVALSVMHIDLTFCSLRSPCTPI